jgi:hypothetical protein
MITIIGSCENEINQPITYIFVSKSKIHVLLNYVGRKKEIPRITSRENLTFDLSSQISNYKNASKNEGSFNP